MMNGALCRIASQHVFGGGGAGSIPRTRLPATDSFALTRPLGVASIAERPSVSEGNKAVYAGPALDTIDVQHVINAYHEAVLPHDGSRLSNLFLPQGGRAFR